MEARLSALTSVTQIDVDLGTFLARVGRVFHVFDLHNSGCTCYGVRAGGRRWFVKHSEDPRGLISLRRAIHVNGLVRHPALPRLHHTFQTPHDGLALVYEWVPGEPLAFGSSTPPEKRRDPSFAPVRFRALPQERVLASLDTIYEVHLRVTEARLIAVDFYDGCLIYDLKGRRTYVYDLDEYRPGPFVLDADRLPGSRRLMAPEEFQRGAIIDEATNVFTLARMAILLLGDGRPTFDAWRGTPEMKAVLVRATNRDRAARYVTVREFVAAWRQAAGTHQEPWTVEEDG
jgi:serine/threonine-protein kinase